MMAAVKGVVAEAVTKLVALTEAATSVSGGDDDGKIMSPRSQFLFHTRAMSRAMSRVIITFSLSLSIFDSESMSLCLSESLCLCLRLSVFLSFYLPFFLSFHLPLLVWKKVEIRRFEDFLSPAKRNCFPFFHEAF